MSMVLVVAGVFVLGAVHGDATARELKQSPSTVATAERVALEKHFEETMSGASLVGQFTIEGQSVRGPQEESYRVSKITRQQDGRWMFTARMRFGDNDIVLPMPFVVEWAGDTPVITLTDQTIEGMGTFTARVLIYGDRYAGTWQHGPVGGHMWGKVTRPDREENP